MDRSDRHGFEVRVYAPEAQRVVLVLDDGTERPLWRTSPVWVGTVERGSHYGLRVDGVAGGRCDGGRTLVDPRATEIWFPPGHRRADRLPGGLEEAGATAMAVAAPWPRPAAPRPTTRPLVVYEAHVRGMTMRRDRDDAGTFAALVGELARLAELGVSVLELLPVQQFDPDEGNYWGYMPLVFGAVHRQYASGRDPAGELAGLVAAAHDHDIEVWLDVVFNHTTEEDEHGPTYNLRGLAEAEYYALNPDGSYLDETGTGNTFDVTAPPAQELVTTALDRFADLGVDGFRFDLASVLARQPDFVRAIGDWADRRGITLVAEPWDMVRYQVGRDFPDDRWKQWNDRFRDDVRRLLRGEPGMVPAVMQRVQGSPDLFDRPLQSVNFVTAHDGMTLFDLVSYNRKYNEANGWDNRDGAAHDHSWNCGWEGEPGAAEAVQSLRRRQLRNAMCLLMLSHGTPMFVAGDEIGRTQGGNNNAYNQDNETSWVDWERAEAFAGLERFVGRLIAFRAEHPALFADDWWGDRLSWFGTAGAVDSGRSSRSFAWTVEDLTVMVNMWWEPLAFAVPAPGPWVRCIDTTDEAGFVAPAPAETTVTLGPRSIVVLRR